ncbi:MAG: CBS domain-containing protein [Gammaproteobacteria bacterium]|nr:CBS domain-containing protein [Gammaproteobacteria bacterium]MDH3446856.1 CBS domain-containing protein [Gammaproteobacteria bacterium]MDH3547599.1 CBS domain-containing protein [Gammaproteobacteria bacterium]
MRVGEFCNREVVVIEAESSITEAARIMREYHVGDVVIVKTSYGKQTPVGILTDRDIALEIVAKGADPEIVQVGDAMSFELVTVDENDDLMHAIEIMRDKGIRRVPVVDADEALVGIMTVDDLLDLLSGVFVDIVHLVDRQRRRETRTRP